MLLVKEETVLQGMINRLIDTGICYEWKLMRKKLTTRISRKPFPLQMMTNQKHLENVEYFKYLGSTANYARCTREIKSRNSMAKAAFKRKKNLFNRKLDLNLRKEPVKC